MGRSFLSRASGRCPPTASRVGGCQHERGSRFGGPCTPRRPSSGRIGRAGRTGCQPRRLHRLRGSGPARRRN
uniref:Uncharacterized protein n=1 Tax=uncultured marine virus TaxID=186617 RepID=A0A0F7LAC5_9VIRU|nr:hypothetical protein [uncultured marine virus]